MSTHFILIKPSRNAYPFHLHQTNWECIPSFFHGLAGNFCLMCAYSKLLCIPRLHSQSRNSARDRKRRSAASRAIKLGPVVTVKPLNNQSKNYDTCQLFKMLLIYFMKVGVHSCIHCVLILHCTFITIVNGLFITYWLLTSY